MSQHLLSTHAYAKINLFIYLFIRMGCVAKLKSDSALVRRGDESVKRTLSGVYPFNMIPFLNLAANIKHSVITFSPHSTFSHDNLSSGISYLLKRSAKYHEVILLCQLILKKCETPYLT